MGRSLVIFFASSAVSAFLLGVGVAMSYRLAFDSQRGRRLRSLAVWFLRGCCLPGLVWVIMNLGISWNLQPFMPEVQEAQNSGKPWFPTYLEVVGQGWFLIGSYWTAITLAWSLILAANEVEGEVRKSFIGLCTTCFLAMLIPAGGLTVGGGLPLAGIAAILILAPMAGYGKGVLKPKKAPPMYARAIARLKFGKYAEAEWEIIRELEKREDDFEGWMMMAELYAKQFRDVGEAEQTVLEICDQPRTTTSQVSVALHRLADWQLNLAKDPEAARRSLQMICDRLPGSHLAHMAQLRLNQLPRTEAELHEQKAATTIPLPALGDNFDENTPSVPSIDYSKAVAAANGYVQQLKLNPNHVSAREKLARSFAEQLQQPDRGIEQLALLLNLPEVSDLKRAEWLSLTAAWHIKYRRDKEAARKVLERLSNDFPGTPQAFSARRRLQLMDREARSSG